MTIRMVVHGQLFWWSFLPVACSFSRGRSQKAKKTDILSKSACSCSFYRGRLSIGNHSDGHFQKLPVACSFSHGRPLKAKISDILPKNHLVAAVSTVGGSRMDISENCL